MTSTPGARWQTLERRTLIREIIEARVPDWPNGPRPFQIDCWAKTLDGISQLTVVPTGGGKTSLFYGPLLVVQDLINQCSETRNIGKLPRNPIIIIVTPLNALGDVHAKEMREMGIRAVSVNAETIRQAQNDGRNLFAEIQRCEWSVSLWSPEKLIDRAADAIMRDETFRSNLLLLGVDEAHVVDQWGQDFRVAYGQIGKLRKRLPQDLPLVAVTATLVEGREKRSVCAALGLVDGAYSFTCQSCERLNIRLVMRRLSSSINGFKFPELSWVLRAGGTVVYCRTINLVFRLALFLWDTQPPGPDRLRTVRVWHSLTSDNYNTETLELFEQGTARVIIAMVAFGMGINRCDIHTVVNLGLPDSLSSLVQQRFRVDDVADFEMG